MQLLKKLVWTIVVVLLFGGFGYGAILLKNNVSAGNYASYWQEEQIKDGNFVLVVMGDSTALGVGASNPQKSFTGLLIDNIQQTTGKSVKVVNLATPNATYAEVLAKQVPKMREQKADIVLVSAGRIDIDKKTFDLLTLQNLLQALPGVDSYITEIPATYDSAKNKIIEIANAAIHENADKTSVDVVPLYSATVKSIYDLSYYDWDFVHPNDKGHKLWADTIWTEIQ